MPSAAFFVILLGPPGSGKGTQATKLAVSAGVPAISTGELLRREAVSGSALGAQVSGFLGAGLLVDDDLMNHVVTQRLSRPDCSNGAILDGYPRTTEQAQFFDRWLYSTGYGQPLVFDFVVTPEEVVQRLRQRRQCPECGQSYSAEFDVYGKDLVCSADGAPLVRRMDDNPDTIRERLRIYQEKTFGLVRHYSDRRYYAVDAMQMPDRVGAQLLSLLDAETVPSVLRGQLR